MRIAVITHPQDRRLRTWLDGYLQASPLHYQLDGILLAARWQGLRWFFTDPGQPFRPADAAIVHADMSLMSQPYLDLAARYPVAVNGAARDIRKRLVSRNLIDRSSDWTGAVLVKSDLNSRGGPERFLDKQVASLTGQAPPDSVIPEYELFDNPGAVPDSVWSDPTRVVERYLPEKRGTNNVLRVWSFLGDYERCNWYSSPETIVKGRNIEEFGPCEVPPELRAERKRLGFDYGKFDFAIGPEGPVLYDANKTPAVLAKRPDLMHAAAQSMSQALLRMIRG